MTCWHLRKCQDNIYFVIIYVRSALKRAIQFLSFINCDTVLKIVMTAFPRKVNYIKQPIGVASGHMKITGFVIKLFAKMLSASMVGYIKEIGWVPVQGVAGSDWSVFMKRQLP